MPAASWLALGVCGELAVERRPASSVRCVVRLILLLGLLLVARVTFTVFSLVGDRPVGLGLLAALVVASAIAAGALAKRSQRRGKVVSNTGC